MAEREKTAADAGATGEAADVPAKEIPGRKAGEKARGDVDLPQSEQPFAGPGPEERDLPTVPREAPTGPAERTTKKYAPGSEPVD